MSSTEQDYHNHTTKSLGRSIKEVRVHFKTLIRSIGKELGFDYLIERLNKIL